MICSEDRRSEVTFKYYLPDHEDDVWLHVNAKQMYSLIHDIDQKCRGVIKYDDKATDEMIKLAEEIRDVIHTGIDMDRIR